MILACSLLLLVQINLSVCVPAYPEGITAHTVPSSKQTSHHAAGAWRLPKAREGTANGEKIWDTEAGEDGRACMFAEKEREWRRMAEGQHADWPGPDWHFLGQLTDTGRQRQRGGVGKPGKVKALRMFCPNASPRSVARR